LGLELITDAAAVAPTLSVVKYPEGLDDVAFRAKMEEYDIVVAGGVGPLKGKVSGSGTWAIFASTNWC